MLYKAPPIDRRLRKQLDELHELRQRLGAETTRLAPWMGTLRRHARADSVSSSTAIEGFDVSRADAVALANNDYAADPADADRMAVACYARAMDHVGVMAVDPGFRWLERVILDLHFDAC